MREIKFKCFDKLSPKMYFGHSLSVNAGGSFNYLDTDGQWKEFFDDERIVLMQFTGLKDKNGVDIYEGDIVKCGYGTAEVYFMLGAWYVRWVDDREAEGEFLGFNKKVRRAREDNEQFEVIGNIHQNPELLK